MTLLEKKDRYRDTGTVIALTMAGIRSTKNQLELFLLGDFKTFTGMTNNSRKFGLVCFDFLFNGMSTIIGYLVPKLSS